MTDVERAEYDDVVRQLMQKCEQLAAECTRLRAEKNGALSVCQEMYNDPSVPAALRLKAAGLALQFETPRLESVPPPMDLAAEPIIPLAELVTMRRKHVDQLLLEQPEIRIINGRVVVLDKGDGSD